MNLSLVAVKALGFVYKEPKIDYSKYVSIKLIEEPIFNYTYILENMSNLIIGDLDFNYLYHLGYVESTKSEGTIIRVFLNAKCFRDLENKQEI